MRLTKEEKKLLYDCIFSHRASCKKALNLAKGGEKGYDIPDFEKEMVMLKTLEHKLYDVVPTDE